MSISAFQTKQRELKAAKQWFSLYSKPYHGGGGGIGRFVNPSISLEIYHQEYDGATNYHKPSKEFGHYLDKAVESFSKQIVEKALALLKNDVKDLAVKAAAEAQQILDLAKTD